MTKEEKQLLLKDICARLPYGVKMSNINAIHNGLDLPPITIDINDYENSNPLILINSGFVPYLRPMSSMTDDERKVYKSFISTQHHEWDGHGTSTDYVETDDVEKYFTWLNKKGFDYSGLIPMGLALEAKEGMYES